VAKSWRWPGEGRDTSRLLCCSWWWELHKEMPRCTYCSCSADTLWAECLSQGDLLDAAGGLLVLCTWEGEPSTVERGCMTQKQNSWLIKLAFICCDRALICTLLYPSRTHYQRSWQSTRKTSKSLMPL